MLYRTFWICPSKNCLLLLFCSLNYIILLNSDSDSILLCLIPGAHSFIHSLTHSFRIYWNAPLQHILYQVLERISAIKNYRILWKNSPKDEQVMVHYKREPACQCRRHETQVWSLGWEDPLEEGRARHSSILAWRIPWIKEPGGLQSTG